MIERLLGNFSGFPLPPVDDYQYEAPPAKKARPGPSSGSDRIRLDHESKKLEMKATKKKFELETTLAWQKIHYENQLAAAKYRQETLLNRSKTKSEIMSMGVSEQEVILIKKNRFNL